MSIFNTHVSIYELDKIFKKAKNIFFVGIGGISMSSLAEYCIYHEKKVFGYDASRGDVCKNLEKRAHIRYCSSPDNVMGMDLVVYSNAIDKDNFEIKTATALKIPLVSRSNFLAYIMSNYRVRIGVSGTHGKSTLTSMLGRIFRYAGYDPTVICGAKMKEFNAPFRFGRREYFIFEACEYMNSFLNFIPTDAIVTNIDFDHPDFFEDLGHIQRSFRKFILPSQRVYINADDSPSSVLSHPFKITFGFSPDADYVAKPISCDNKNSFLVIHNGKEIARVDLSISGRYNISNAICAFAVAHQHKIAPVTIATALSSFEGVARRQELIKRITNKNGDEVCVFLDYAHHPTEIKASLSAFREMGYKNILCVFQSHTFSRTSALYGEFLSAFGDATELIFAPIFSAREQNTFNLSEEKMANELGARYISDLSEIANAIKDSASDCVVIMGAGDIDKLKNYI